MTLDLLIFLPVNLLVLAAIGIVILQQLRPSIGYAWLIGALTGMLTVGIMLFLRWRLPIRVEMNWWRPFTEFSTPPAFQLDTSSWPYAFSIVLLTLAFVLTDAARLEREARPSHWAAGMGLAGLGLLAITAANPITLIYVWTAVDVVEFVMVISAVSGRHLGVQTITLFSVRVASTLLVILAILTARSLDIPFALSPIPSEVALIMLLAAGLRLGVLPLNIPYSREVYALRGLGTMMRFIGPASSMVVLGRMPEGAVPPELKGVILFFSALAALYGAVMWLVADSELNGRPYWFIALAALGVASVANGSPRSSIAWGMVLIASGGLLFFYSARRRQILFIPLLGLLGISGLPFTPTAAGWQGLVGQSQNSFTVLLLIAVLFLIWGYLRHILSHVRDELYPMARWVQTVYTTGLVFLVIGHWVGALLAGGGSLTTGIWWASVSVTFVAALGVVLAFTFHWTWILNPSTESPPALYPAEPNRDVFTEFPPEPGEMPLPQKSAATVVDNTQATRRWVSLIIRRVGGSLAAFFSLDWLYRFLVGVYHLVQHLIQLLTLMFEGDGGVLWSLVMLALLISLIMTGWAQ